LADHGVPGDFFIEPDGERGVYQTGMAGIHQGNGTMRSAKTHLPVHLNAAAVVAKIFPDQFAITAVLKPREEHFPDVPGEDGNGCLKAIRKAVYQVFTFSSKKTSISFMPGKIPSFNNRNKGIEVIDLFDNFSYRTSPIIKKTREKSYYSR
jgi:hypothetical protein